MILHDVERDDGGCDAPIMLITTPGADPEQRARGFRGGERWEGQLHELDDGGEGGEDGEALRLIRNAAKGGRWLCLENLHLVVSWLGVLGKRVAFRLWLTTELHRSFPPILLQASLKITDDALVGIKKNMERTCSSWSNDFIGSGDAKRCKMLLLLAFFHAFVQERLMAGTFALSVDGGGDC